MSLLIHGCAGRGLGDSSTIEFVVNENESRQPLDSTRTSARSPRVDKIMPVVPKNITKACDEKGSKFYERVIRIKKKLEGDSDGLWGTLVESNSGSKTDDIETVTMLKEISKMNDEELPAEIGKAKCRVLESTGLQVIRKSGIYSALEKLVESTSSEDIVRPVAETVTKKLKVDFVGISDGGDDDVQERCEADLQTKKARRTVDVASKM